MESLMLRPHRRAHAWIWALLALLLPLIIIGALVLKYTRASLPPNQRLAPPAVEIRP
jgi:uncharacterized membrane-anchored protein YhcB (DUF1043 family)